MLNNLLPLLSKATSTLCDLSAAILFKLAHLCLNAFSLIEQGWIGYVGTHVPLFVHKLGLIKPRQT